MPSIAPLPRFRFFTRGSLGTPVRPLVGGRVYFYEAGTTTPKDTFTDSTGLVKNTNPVILDARGEADIWLGDGTYKMQVTDALGINQGGPVDGIKGTDALRQEIVTSFSGNDGFNNIGSFPSYQTLRSYLGGANRVLVSGSGISGEFVRDTADNSSPDNGGTIIVDALGRRWKRVFSDTLLLEWFEVVFDGSDETAKVQAAADAIQSGQVLTQKSGRPASVTTVEFYQNRTRYMKLLLRTVDNAPGFSTPFTITSFGAYPNHNGYGLVFEDCYCNGNRLNQATVPSVGEDGGMHGFRVERGVRNLRIIRGWAEYCTTDGLIYFNSARTRRFPLTGVPITDPFVDDIIVDSFTSIWNRRHGGSGFSMRGVHHIGKYRFNNNGSDIPGRESDPWTSGAKGARLSSTAQPYPNGFDLEQESQDSGRFTFEDVHFGPGGEFLDNARRGLLIYTRGNRAAQGYQIAKRISVKGCRIGVGFAADAQTETVFAMEQNNAPFSGQAVDLQGLEFTDNELVIPVGYTTSTPVTSDCIDGAVVKRNQLSYKDGTRVPRTLQFCPPQARSNVNSDISGNGWTLRAPIAGQFNFSTFTKSFDAGDLLYLTQAMTSATTVDTRVAQSSGLVEISVRQANGNQYRILLRLADATNTYLVDAGYVAQANRYLAAAGQEVNLYTVVRYSIASGTLRLEHVGAAYNAYAGALDIRISQVGARIE